MTYTNLSDRSYETTKLLRRSKGVFSKTRRTLTSPPQFRIARLSGPEGFTTTALFERCFNKRYSGNTIKGTVTPTRNCKLPKTDVGDAFSPDWKPSSLSYKGNVSWKRISSKKHFLSDRSNTIGPIKQYISDRRPRGLSPQQLAVAFHRIPVRCTITLLRILNGTAGYRTDSEDSLTSPGHYSRIRIDNVQKTVFGKNAVIPDICLERRSTGTGKCNKTERTVIPY